MTRLFRIAVIITLANLCGPIQVFAKPTTLTGYVTEVRDGDTIKVGPIPIRLRGISAPELNEPFGLQSKVFMINLVKGKRIRCNLNGHKTYDRFVGICYFGGSDIGAAVIKAGLALDCPRFSHGKYIKIESKAARAKLKLPSYCW
ncbi:MAG: hypothetical protein CBB68_00355 [Rhodospirillaceae bacterium TMED8]|nr:nuclease [Magnetovibrio sp.]OUT53339.1 MAG: hypothetical protein CBB68_00355 [Rhodospirillaceae bacterium TMED8]|tara:strand:+ start:172 stop:606 length:435 start_codon:yes stop_codon:yes gene_type:complete